jgi:hypothetical protein
VYSGVLQAYLGGRNGRFPVEVTVPVLRIRRRNTRTVAKLARALAALERDPGSFRPAPRRAAKLSFGR